MRFPAGTGFAIGLVSLILADHALSQAKVAPRFTDPDLIALEKIGARAKQAMDAFVLRPRLQDAYNTVCSNCMRDNSVDLSARIARAPDRSHIEKSAIAGLEEPQLLKPRYASLPSARVKRANTLKRRTALRLRILRRNAEFPQKLEADRSWDAELRR